MNLTISHSGGENQGVGGSRRKTFCFSSLGGVFLIVCCYSVILLKDFSGNLWSFLLFWKKCQSVFRISVVPAQNGVVHVQDSLGRALTCMAFGSFLHRTWGK